jgi:hypothetical protein
MILKQYEVNKNTSDFLLYSDCALIFLWLRKFEKRLWNPFRLINSKIARLSNKVDISL